MAFMDLEKTYDRIDRSELWQILRIYGAGSNLLKALQSSCSMNRACVSGDSGMSELFDVKIGLGDVTTTFQYKYIYGIIHGKNIRPSGV